MLMNLDLLLRTDPSIPNDHSNRINMSTVPISNGPFSNGPNFARSRANQPTATGSPSNEASSYGLAGIPSRSVTNGPTKTATLTATKTARANTNATTWDTEHTAEARKSNVLYPEPCPDRPPPPPISEGSGRLAAGSCTTDGPRSSVGLTKGATGIGSETGKGENVAHRRSTMGGKLLLPSRQGTVAAKGNFERVMTSLLEDILPTKEGGRRGEQAEGLASATVGGDVTADREKGRAAPERKQAEKKPQAPSSTRSNGSRGRASSARVAAAGGSISGRSRACGGPHTAQGVAPSPSQGRPFNADRSDGKAVFLTPVEVLMNSARSEELKGPARGAVKTSNDQKRDSVTRGKKQSVSAPRLVEEGVSSEETPRHAHGATKVADTSYRDQTSSSGSRGGETKPPQSRGLIALSRHTDNAEATTMDVAATSVANRCDDGIRREDVGYDFRRSSSPAINYPAVSFPARSGGTSAAFIAVAGERGYPPAASVLGSASSSSSQRNGRGEISEKNALAARESPTGAAGEQVPPTITTANTTNRRTDAAGSTTGLRASAGDSPLAAAAAAEGGECAVADVGPLCQHCRRGSSADMAADCDSEGSLPVALLRRNHAELLRLVRDQSECGKKVKRSNHRMSFVLDKTTASE